MKSGSDVYPQVLDSKLHEPGRSWLWAPAAPVRDGKVTKRGGTRGRGNGKNESSSLSFPKCSANELQ